VQPTSGKNSQNPKTDKKEYFLDKIAKAAVGGLTGFATGGPAGAAIGAGSALLSSDGSPAPAGGGAAPAAGGAPVEQNPLPESVKAVQDHRVQSGLTSLSPFTSGRQGDLQASEYGDPRGAPMAQDTVLSPMQSVTDMTTAALMSGIRNSATGRPQFFDTGRSAKILDKQGMPSRNMKTGKQEYYDANLTEAQRRATQWAHDNKLLPTNRTATGGALEQALQQRPEMRAAYNSYMQRTAPQPAQPKPTPQRNYTPSVPASPNQQQPVASQAQQAPAQAGGGSGASGQGLYVVSAIPSNTPGKPGDYLLSDGTRRSFQEVATIASQGRYPNIMSPVDGFGAADFPNASKGTNFGAYPSNQNSLIGFEIEKAPQPKLNSTTTAQPDAGRIDKATGWAISKGYLQPGQQARDGALEKALGTDRTSSSWKEYDAFMNNRQYTPAVTSSAATAKPEAPKMNEVTPVAPPKPSYQDDFDSFKNEINQTLEGYFSQQSEPQTEEPTTGDGVGAGNQFDTPPATPTMPTFSTLTPERNPRFRSRQGEGTLARNF
jgi:hypothetical protein